ncbi:MAG: hypothetical protein AAF573_08460 [Bacteroidota bacterium]
MRKLTKLLFIYALTCLPFFCISQFSIIQDIRSGSPDSSPGDFAVFNGALYFAANDGTNGKELWKYDPAGSPSTSIVADIRSGSSSSSPSELMVFNNKLYFVANNGSNGSEMWEYDGVNSPSMVMDIFPGSGNGVSKGFTEYNGKLYFEALTFPAGYALWEYDGTNSPSLVSDMNTASFPTGLGVGVTDLTVYNGKLYFAADSQSDGYELWSYNGSGSPTLVHDINSGGESSTPGDLYVFAGKLYFHANDGSNGFELWEHDGNSTSIVANINSGSANSFPQNFMEFDGKLYFNANDGNNGEELYVYDGNNSPSLVSNIRSGSAGSSPDDLIVYNNKLFFSANNGSNGIELWSYDGTNAPSMVDDLYPGSLNGSPDDLIVFDGKLVMEASDNQKGFELWSYSEGCNCSGTNAIPTVAGTYNSTCSVTDGDWRHFCDGSGNLLLSLEIGSSGAIINDNEVSLKIESPTASFFTQGCGSSPACFIDLASGATTFNRSWDVSPTTQPSTGEVGVRFYFTQNEYDAVNAEINSQGQTQLTSMQQMWFYKVTNGSLGQFPEIPNIQASDVLIIENDASVASTDKWVFSTKTPGSEFAAEYKVSSFSGGGGGGAAGGLFPLPVEMIYFNVSPSGNNVQLKWATASEINNQGFKLHHSTDGVNWDLLDFIEGNGTSTNINSYDFLDRNPNWGINYYKLVQLDYDGKSEAFDVVSINLNENNQERPHIFPNPVEENLNVVDIEGEGYIYDFSGNLVFQTVLEKGANLLNISSLNSGVFHLIIVQPDGRKHVERFTKVH